MITGTMGTRAGLWGVTESKWGEKCRQLVRECELRERRRQLERRSLTGGFERVCCASGRRLGEGRAQGAEERRQSVQKGS